MGNRRLPLAVMSLLIASSLPVCAIEKPKVAASSSAPAKSSAAMSGGMDMKNCPMMMPSKHVAYIGSAAVFSDDFDWKVSPNPVPQKNKPVLLKFDISWKKDHKALSNLEVVHEKLCHLLIVSRDLNEFQHIHPDVTAPGKMSVTTEFPKDGQYKMYLQFTVKGDGEYTIVKDLNIGNGKVKTAAAVLGEDADKAKMVDGFKFTLPNRPVTANVQQPMLVSIEKDGKPVTNIQRYLGAGGHGCMISQDLTQFLHIHPMLVQADGFPYESPILFQATVPKPGKYRAWMQFMIDGKIRIGIWDLVIKKATE
jgi:hypothetical protein